jgi:hypothetical protein
MTGQQRLEAAFAIKAEKKAVIATADATDLPTALALLNEIKAKLNEMNAPAA